MKRECFVLLFAVAACTPAVAPPPFDAGDGGDRSPCATDQLIGPNRLLRAADGSAETVPCHP